MKHRALFLLLAPGLISCLSAAVEAPYIFVNFEAVSAWPDGVLKPERAGWQITAPGASVRNADDRGASRHLEITGAAVLIGDRFTGDGRTWLEVWARPQAVRMAEGAEFLDFDGAAVALFLTESGHAELHGLHITEQGCGHWIASGVKVPLTNGAAADWLSVGIAQNWADRTWELTLNGQVVLTGMGRGDCADGKIFELWCYGHDEGLANRFDDVLVSALPPSVLEARLAEPPKRRQTATAELSESGKRVGKNTLDEKRRKHHLPRPDLAKAGKAAVLGISLQVVGGGRHIGEFESKNGQGGLDKFALYSPGYDEQGNPKPLEVVIRCDVKLEEGSRLDDIEWAITEDKKEGAQSLRVIVWGDFANGPSIKATVPSAWSNQALSIVCGSLGLKKPAPERP